VDIRGSAIPVGDRVLDVQAEVMQAEVIQVADVRAVAIRAVAAVITRAS
jgi:hypothetical protein